MADPGSQSPTPQTSAKRVLVVVSETVQPQALKQEISSRLRDGAGDVMVVCPATTSLLKLAAGEVDEATAEARERLDRIVAEISGDGLRVQGEVGDSDPKTAMSDALAKFEADEIFIVTAPDDKARWLDKEALAGARADLTQPITHITVADSGAGSGVVDVDRTGPSAERGREGDLDTYGIPRMPARNTLSIIIGIVGTVVLGILAGDCFDDISHEDMDGGCALRIGLAWAALIVTVFHVAALLFFRAVRYRGTWERLTAWTLIVGIPAAVVVSILAS